MAIIKTSFTLRLALIDHAKIKKIAESQNRSINNMIETLVKDAIKEYEKENGEIKLTDYIRLSGVIYIRQAYKLGFCLFLCSTIQNRSDISIKMEVIAVYRTITIDDSLQ